MTTSLPWGADVPISMPQPLTRDETVLKQMGAFCFTAGGLMHSLRTTDVEDYLTPTFQPRFDPGVYRA